MTTWSLDHNLEAEDHLRVVPALGGADVAVGEGEPPGEPHRQILLASGKLRPHRGSGAGGGKLLVPILFSAIQFYSVQSNFILCNPILFCAIQFYSMQSNFIR